MASSSPGCASAISGRGTGLTPGLGSMPPACANHGWRTTKGSKQVVRAAVKRREYTVMDCCKARCWDDSDELTAETAQACGIGESGEAGELSAYGRELGRRGL